MARKFFLDALVARASHRGSRGSWALAGRIRGSTVETVDSEIGVVGTIGGEQGEKGALVLMSDAKFDDVRPIVSGESGSESKVVVMFDANSELLRSWGREQDGEGAMVWMLESKVKAVKSIGGEEDSGGGDGALVWMSGLQTELVKSIVGEKYGEFGGEVKLVFMIDANSELVRSIGSEGDLARTTASERIGSVIGFGSFSSGIRDIESEHMLVGKVGEMVLPGV